MLICDSMQTEASKWNEDASFECAGNDVQVPSNPEPVELDEMEARMWQLS